MTTSNLSNNQWQYSLSNKTLQFGSSKQACLSSERSRFHSIIKRLAKKTGLYEIVTKRVFVVEEERETDMEFVIKKSAHNNLRFSDLLLTNKEVNGEQFVGIDGLPVDFSCRLSSL